MTNDSSKELVDTNSKETILNPKQLAFLSYYTDPKSETFSNALQSALKAGYAKEYAENITHLMPDWLSESIGDTRMLKKAERNLEKALDIDPADPALGDRGLRATMFVAERLGKKKYGQKVDVNAEVSVRKLIALDE